MMLDRRFGGMARLYGVEGAASIAKSHVMIVGIGGVGSWVAESLARSGVGGIQPAGVGAAGGAVDGGLVEDPRFRESRGEVENRRGGRGVEAEAKQRGRRHRSGVGLLLLPDRAEASARQGRGRRHPTRDVGVPEEGVGPSGYPQRPAAPRGDR